MHWQIIGPLKHGRMLNSIQLAFVCRQSNQKITVIVDERDEYQQRYRQKEASTY